MNTIAEIVREHWPHIADQYGDGGTVEPTTMSRCIAALEAHDQRCADASQERAEANAALARRCAEAIAVWDAARDPVAARRRAVSAAVDVFAALGREP